MSAPGVLDPSRHYQNGTGRASGMRGGMSEMERKMMTIMQHTTASDDEEEGEKAADFQSSALSKLPIEIVESILENVILPTAQQQSQITLKENNFRASIMNANAVSLCLVARQFDQIVRPRMYRTILVEQRRMRRLLRTLESNATLASYVRQCSLESQIWTSDLDENVIVAFFKAIRQHVIAMRVGANESSLLPYLFHGEEERKEDLMPAAIRVLYLCWRDEADYDPHALQNEEEEEESRLNETLAGGNAVGRDAFSARQTLVPLFELDANQFTRLSPSPALHDCTYANLQHLTLNIYSQAQLDQLFLQSGFFIRRILPLLTFLRIELPLTVLQCSTVDTSSRNTLARHWPTEKFLVQGSSHYDARLADMQEYVTLRNEKAASSYDSATDENLPLAACSTVLLRSLLTRVMLNVHRNDAVLFGLLLKGAHPTIDQNWSIKAAMATYVLAKSLERQLGRKHGVLHDDDNDAPLLFPLLLYRQEGADVYWKSEWEKMDKEKDRQARAIMRQTNATRDDTLFIGDEAEEVRTSLLLRWPVAREAFFRFSAMV